MENIARPTVIEKELQSLIEGLSEDDKPSISIAKAAELVGADPETLRVAIANGTCPFGFGGQHRVSGSRFGRVSKLALWSFLTKGIYDFSGTNNANMCEKAKEEN